mgnify:CR=1 FL=1
MELASGRLVQSIPATRAEFEVRHLAAHSLERVAVIQAHQAPLDEAAAWMERQRTLWTARLDALDELLRAEEVRASSVPRMARGIL